MSHHYKIVVIYRISNILLQIHCKVLRWTNTDTPLQWITADVDNLKTFAQPNSIWNVTDFCNIKTSLKYRSCYHKGPRNRSNNSLNVYTNEQQPDIKEWPHDLEKLII